eukprot:GHVU01177423.1.p1 GENE.GHVU01177423.1~~GHVU01177423.1.p1  ORF type:complete len:113 (-),score=11.55 GHVU01177423.1:43-381(-)
MFVDNVEGETSPPPFITSALVPVPIFAVAVYITGWSGDCHASSLSVAAATKARLWTVARAVGRGEYLFLLIGVLPRRTEGDSVTDASPVAVFRMADEDGVVPMELSVPWALC